MQANQMEAPHEVSLVAPHPTKLLLTVEETCQALSMGRSLLYRLFASEQIFSVKVGNRRLVPVAALHEFVEQLVAMQKAG